MKTYPLDITGLHNLLYYNNYKLKFADFDFEMSIYHALPVAAHLSPPPLVEPKGSPLLLLHLLFGHAPVNVHRRG